MHPLRMNRNDWMRGALWKLVFFAAGFLIGTNVSLWALGSGKESPREAELKRDIDSECRQLGFVRELTEEALLNRCASMGLEKPKQVAVSETTDNALPAERVQQNERDAVGGIRMVFIEGFNSSSTDISSKEPLIDGVTVILPTFKREICLFKNWAIKEYAALDIVDRIILSWNDPETLPTRELFKRFSQPEYRGKVIFAMQSQNSLLNRFRPDLVRTRAVLSLDDDRGIPKDHLEKMYAWWKLNPDRFAGAFIRKVDCETVNDKLRCSYITKFTNFNIMLTGGGLMAPRKHYERLWAPSVEPLRAYVEKYFNCEDLLFNMLLPPEFGLKVHLSIRHLEFRLVDSHDKGLSSKGDHMARRDNCVKFFHTTGGLPIPPMQDRSVINHGMPSKNSVTRFGYPAPPDAALQKKRKP